MTRETSPDGSPWWRYQIGSIVLDLRDVKITTEPVGDRVVVSLTWDVPPPTLFSHPRKPAGWRRRVTPTAP